MRFLLNYENVPEIEREIKTASKKNNIRDKNYFPDEEHMNEWCGNENSDRYSDFFQI